MVLFKQKTPTAYIAILSSLMLMIITWSSPIQAKSYSCPASSSWVTNPNPPEEIPLGQNAQFCQFYQFSWQWFLQLMSPAGGGNQFRNFEVVDNYPILNADPSGKPVNSCDESASKKLLFIRSTKPVGSGGTFHFPERTGQAGGGDTIYDQNGNVVFFNIRFSKNLCDIGNIQSNVNFPPGTTELKSAWKVISDAEKSRYYWIEADIDGVQGTEQLGLIGFHFVRSTKLHPEFIWATFEHKDNDPDCTQDQVAETAPASGWSFTSEKCASDPSKCTFNKAAPNKAITGTPTEICRVYPYGTYIKDNKAGENLTAITELNEQIVGPNGYLSQLSSTDPMSVFQNYFIVGALWENLITQPSSDISNQRGSLRLANTVAETTFQNVDLTSSFVSNCFGCHNYKVKTSNTLPSSTLSHIFNNIIQGVCTSPTDVNAGPIWNNTDAQTKCPTTCSSKGGWNGQWKTTETGVMSVCGCCGS